RRDRVLDFLIHGDRHRAHDFDVLLIDLFLLVLPGSVDEHAREAGERQRGQDCQKDQHGSQRNAARRGHSRGFYRRSTLTTAFLRSPRPPGGAWASSGKKIAKSPGGTLSHNDGRSSKNPISFASSKPPAGGRHAASGDHPISSSPSRVS